jgi:hypothetical protein
MGNNHDQFTRLKKLITSMTTKKLKENVLTPNYISAFPLQDQIHYPQYKDNFISALHSSFAY